MLKQFLRLKKFFILRILFSCLLFIISIFIFKSVRLLIPITFLSTLTEFCIVILFIYFSSKVLLPIIDFMQIYYCYDSNKNISFTTLIRQVLQALKSLFERDNCYRKLIAQLVKADTIMKEKLYEGIDENNPYFYLLEFRSNSAFQYVFDRLTNNILTCTFYYVVVTDSDLTLEDYAKGAVFYSRVFPFLFSSTLKSVILIHIIPFIFYIILSLIIHHNIALLFIFLFVFHRIVICSVKDIFVASCLYNLTEPSNEVHENNNPLEPYNETHENNNPNKSFIETQSNDSQTENITPIKIKSSLSDIARTNSDFSIPKQINTGNASLSNMLSQWKNSKDSSEKNTLLQVKGVHKYFKLDNEQMKNLTNYKEELLQDNLVVSNAQIPDKNLFTINDIFTEIKELDIDFLLHIDEI